MTSDWEEKLRKWSKPPSDSEETRCENAIKAIRNALGKSEKLKQRKTRVFSQGSYRNNTNVRLNSDVDVGIAYLDAFFPDYPEGMTNADFGNSSANYHYATFKDEVGEALRDYFGTAAVTRGNKAFDIRENGYHVEADVAPFFEHRRYATSGSYHGGVELRPDNGQPSKVINWPEQHYENGVSKNNATGTRYKSMVRILKCLRNEMDGAGIASAKPIVGFLSECMVWNVPNGHFGNNDYQDDLRNVIAFLYNGTVENGPSSDWVEVSHLKHLFHSSQSWTRQQAHTFLLAAWQYVGFE